MPDVMMFPDTAEEFMESYKVTDVEHVYSNGVEFVPIYRMRQWFQHQPERKKGKWIETTQGDHYKCSCCGVRSAFWFEEENSSSWEADMSEWLSDYCPNCGARMER